MQARADGGRELRGELGKLLRGLARIDLDLAGVVGDEVAQHAVREVQVLVQQGRRRRAHGQRLQRSPGFAQIGDVVGELIAAGVFGDGAHDISARFVGWQHRGQTCAYRFALGLAFDLLRNPDMRFLRQVDQRAAGNADLRRQARALGADRILDHLHHQRLALVQHLLDRLRGGLAMPVMAMAAARLARLPDVGDVQKRGAFQADVDESRLHAG